MPAKNAKAKPNRKSSKSVKPAPKKATKPAPSKNKKTPKGTKGKGKAPKPLIPATSQVLPADDIQYEPQFAIRNAVLSDVLRNTSRGLAKRSTLPVLMHYLVSADQATQTVKVTTTNLELAMWHTVPAVVQTSGAICLPCRLAEIADKLDSDGSVRLAVHQKTMTALLTSDNLKTSIKAIDASEFPEVNRVGKGHKKFGTFELTRDDVAEIQQRVGKCAATEETRPTLAAICLNVMERRGNTAHCDLVAADGYRLAVLKKRFPVKIENEIKIEAWGKRPAVALIPAPLFEQVLKLVRPGNDNQTVELSLYFDKDGGGRIMFECGESGLVSDLIDGVFPNYNKIVPELSDLLKIPFARREDLQDAVDLAAIYAQDSMNTVRLKCQIPSNQVLVQAISAELGECDRTVTADFDSLKAKQRPKDGFEIAFNVKYLSDALKALRWNGDNRSDARLELHVQTPGAPGTVIGPDYTMVIMPMHITKEAEKSETVSKAKPVEPTEEPPLGEEPDEDPQVAEAPAEPPVQPVEPDPAPDPASAAEDAAIAEAVAAGEDEALEQEPESIPA